MSLHSRSRRQMLRMSILSRDSDDRAFCYSDTHPDMCATSVKATLFRVIISKAFDSKVAQEDTGVVGTGCDLSCEFPKPSPRQGC